jgi:phage baseplate assembly protein W
MDQAMSFPFRVTELGAAALSSRRQVVREALEQLLLTIPGERVNRPNFGCGIQRLVFDGTDPLALATAEYVITTSIRDHLSDLIRLDAVRVTVEEATVLVDILYTVVGTGEESALTIAQPLQVSP